MDATDTYGVDLSEAGLVKWSLGSAVRLRSKQNVTARVLGGHCRRRTQERQREYVGQTSSLFGNLEPN
jgi:hypothetical protein